MSDERENSIILGDGGILVSWKPKDVTWQAVLQAARAANSEQGGWNNKTHWKTLGLDKLVESGPGPAAGRKFLKRWTLNSLDKKALPSPRLSNFQFDLRRNAEVKKQRGDVMMDGSHKLGIRSEPADEENRLNWWLYMAQRATGKNLTYELPLCAEADGLLRSDLVHFVPENGLVEIIELKKGLGKKQKDSRDSPLMALVEAICYGLQLLRCWEALKRELKPHLNVEPFELKHLHLILAAPDFGKNCSAKSKNLTPDLAVKMRAIVSAVQQAVGEGKHTIRPKFTLSFGNVIETNWTLEAILTEPGREIPQGSILNSTTK